MDRKIIITGDNSKTLLIPELNETYHSTKGALTETNHVFIRMGLQEFAPKQKSVRIFEMGFGTGLNLLACLQFIEKSPIQINYTTLELYPLDIEVIRDLDYVKDLPESIQNQFYEAHQADWNSTTIISPLLSLYKKEGDLLSINLDSNSFDLIFYDAFGPKVQPELWNTPVLAKLYNALDSGGIFVTYCAQGQFRRNLKSCGFEVEKLPGPPGKREMVRAVKR